MFFISFTVLRKIETTAGNGILTALSEPPFKEEHKAEFQILLPSDFLEDKQIEEINNNINLLAGQYKIIFIRDSILLLN